MFELLSPNCNASRIPAEDKDRLYVHICRFQKQKAEFFFNHFLSIFNEKGILFNLFLNDWYFQITFKLAWFK